MAATAIPVDTVPSINPASGEVIERFERTSAALLPQIVARARAAQSAWSQLSIEKRCEQLRILRERMMVSRNVLADAVVAESGKPRVEALFADIFVALDTAEYFSKNAARLLRPERVPHHSTAAKAKFGREVSDPVGVGESVGTCKYTVAMGISQLNPSLEAGDGVVC